MQHPKYSIAVIISCFNYERFVGRAIESVLPQCNDRFELLVVDDGSSDRSWEVIQRYSVAKIFRIVNGGAARACFYAFQRCDAPFVLFLDADDELAPGSLDRIANHLDSGVAKLQFPLIPIDERGSVLGPPTPRLAKGRTREPLVSEVMRTGSYTSPPTSGNVFCRALCELLAEVDYEQSVDGVTLFAAPFFGDIVSLDEPLGFYRLHGRNYSQSGSRPTAQRFDLEADRFLVRHAHLGRILAQRNVAPLPDGRTLFFYRERRLYETILSGASPRVRDVLPMLWLLLLSRRPIGHRAVMIIFLTLCGILPHRHVGALLHYRLQTGRRSPLGMIRRMLAASG